MALERNKKITSGQSGLFDAHQATVVETVDKLPEVPDLPQSEKLADEKRLLGVYLNGHPHDDLFKKFSHLVDAKIADLDPHTHQLAVTIGGIVTRVKVVFTKKSNSEMAFVTLEDTTGSVDMVVFPKTYSDTKPYLVADQGLLVTGKLDVREGKKSLVVSKIRSLSESTNAYNQTVIQIPRGTSQSILKQIGQLLKANPGADSIEIQIPQNSHFKTIKLPYTVNYTSDLQKQVYTLINPEESTG
jgi:DNA polymerase-3 subunit alpha